MGDELLTMQSVSRRFRTRGEWVDAAKGITCSVRRDDRIAVMGPSGSGKSTLLALMAKLDEPTDGVIAWPGLGGGSSLRPRHIGVAFQTPSLLPSLSVVENVEIPLLILGEAAGARQRALDALESVGLEHAADRLPEELSGGQMQRAGIARAMVTSPRLLLADEPTGQLDQSTARDLMKMMFAWAAGRGMAVVVATHDEAVARQFKSIWNMDYGHLELGQALRAAS
jgi:ABC-type lipoprotein export system ATPase subunit